MRRRMLGLVMAVGLLVGVVAAPAAAQGKAADSQGGGCQFVGESWSAWATQGPPSGEPQDEVGPWTSRVASTGSVPEGYEDDVGLSEIEDGPGVISRVLAAYCDELAP